MVMRYLWLFMLLLCTAVGVDAADISASIDATSTPEGDPVKGTISITHNRDETVDLSTFLVGTTPVQAEKVKDVEVDPKSPILLTIYRFQLEGQDAGLHVLPSVSVVVGGTRFSSLPSTYQVVKIPKLTKSAPAASGQGGTEPLVLRLEASVDGPTTLYPTQKTRLVYRYFFNQSIDLSVEKLPLLDATGLVKIGEKQLRDAQSGQMTAREISQEVEASVPGTYTFGPSTIEGYAYKSDASGNILARSELMKSIAPPIEVTVLPFPAESKDPAFNGAVGDFTFSASLKGSNEVDVGNDLSLILKIQGKGNLDSVPLPDVCCQPGFVGMFRVSDLPPVITRSGDTKTAVVAIKPLTPVVKEVPPITFSFFNPDDKKYVTLKSNPIPIFVKGTIPQKVAQKKPVAKEKPKPIPEPTPVDLRLSVPTLTAQDLRNVPFGSWWTLLIIPIGIALVGYQLFLRKFLQQRKEIVASSSEKWLKNAKREGVSSPSYFAYLTGALKLRLVEAGILSSSDLPLAQWPNNGVCAEVIAWFDKLEELRFSGKSSVDVKEVERDVSGFFKKISVVPVTSASDFLIAFAPALLFAAVAAGLVWVAIKPDTVGGPDPRLAEAQKSYEQVEASPTLYDKQAALVQTAQIYEDLIREYQPNHGPGQLQAALGSVYGHLGDIPTALWHSRQAAALRPRDGGVQENLEKLQKLLFLDKQPGTDSFLSLPEWIQLFFAACVAAVVVCSLAIWSGSRWMAKVIKPVALCVMLAAVPLVYYRYFSPLYGTVIASANLQSGPSTKFPSIGNVPVASGSHIEVVGLAEHGRWLQVVTPDGTTGYVPSENLRL